VARTGGFGAAARALTCSQPTVSRRIDDLEATLKTKLLTRTSIGVSLTEAGRDIFDRVQTMYNSATAIEHLVQDADKREEGPVGLACSDGIAYTVLAPTLADFFRDNPKISLRLECSLWPADPLPGTIDVTLQYDRVTNPDMIAKPVATIHYGLFGASEYFRLYGRPRTLQEAAQHRYVHHIAQNRETAILPDTTPALQTLADRRLTTNSSAAMVEAIVRGSGIGPMPTWSAQTYPGLEMLDVGEIASVKLWMCIHRDVRRSARIRRVTSWLESVFDARDKPWFRDEFIHPSEFAAMIAASRAGASEAGQRGGRVRSA
jgi:DNA-binding transcriptional LysR family regulator